MVTGAVAAIIYGEPRLTNDIDIVLALPERHAPRLAEAFENQEFYVPPVESIITEIRRAWHGHFNLIHAPTALKADIYLAGEDPLHHWALARRRRVQVSGEAVYVAPPEYVVVRKLEYFRSGGSDKHLRDIGIILQTCGDEIDRVTLDREIARLGLGSQWETVVQRTALPPER